MVVCVKWYESRHVSPRSFVQFDQCSIRAGGLPPLLIAAPVRMCEVCECAMCEGMQCVMKGLK